MDMVKLLHSRRRTASGCCRKIMLQIMVQAMSQVRGKGHGRVLWQEIVAVARVMARYTAVDAAREAAGYAAG